MEKGTGNNKFNSDRGSISAVILFAMFLGVLFVAFFLWMQENQSENPPADLAKETKSVVTVYVTKPAETKPANTTKEADPQTALEEQVQQAAIEAQKAAAVVQASMEAAIAEANRVAAEAEAARKAAEEARIAAEAEAAKIAAEAEAAKKAAEEEAAKRAAAEEAARKAAEAEAAKKAAEEEAARKTAEQTQPAVKFYDNMKVLDAKEHIMHSPKCELVNSIAEEDKQIVEAGIFDLQVQGYMICEHCWAGLTDSDSVPVSDIPSIGIANLRGE